MPEPLSRSPVFLPRRMAIRLLEIAQGAESTPLRLLITCGMHAQAPDRIAPLEPEMRWERAIQNLPNQNRKLWAAFQYIPKILAIPNTRECTADLYLVASLDTPGVLQIHAWRRTGDIVEEVPLQIGS